MVGPVALSDVAGGFGGFIAHQDGTALVVCRGEIDLAVAGALRVLLDEALVASPRVVVDMADVTFIDSSGLRVLAVARLQVAESITVRNAPPAVARVFALSGMDRILTVEPAPSPAPSSGLPSPSV
jgi:anti-anti-sigma factor